MELELTVNGTRADIVLDGEPEWESVIAAVEEDLAARGWVLSEVRLDGAAVTSGESPDAFGKAASHRIEVDAVPDPSALASLAGQLREALPRLVDELRSVGEGFAKGEVQASLEGLDPLLVDLQVALQGLQAVAAIGSGPLSDALEKTGLALGELGAAVQRQSWVEVSDLLLYELVPLLESWARDDSRWS